MTSETNIEPENKPNRTQPDRRFSVAPMMDWTDRHCRYFHRLLTKDTLLYTEMITAQALIHGPRARLLGFDPFEHPVALQIGGSDPSELAKATRYGHDAGYDEINLNVGCPSDRVRSGRFGACLMAEPELVGRCLAAMKDATDRPVTVKCRIGIDDQDIERDLDHFVETIAARGISNFIIHARKAWLTGLSPKENRHVPPLEYERVYRLKAKFPELEIILNGGVETVQAAPGHLAHLDGIMMGRAAYHRPWQLAEIDTLIFGRPPSGHSRGDVMREFIQYVRRELDRGTRLHQMTKHILGLYHGQPGARAFRRHLSENATAEGAGIAVLEQALAHVHLDSDYTTHSAAIGLG